MKTPEVAPATVTAPSRESFFALYWDHARPIIRAHIAEFANIQAEKIFNEWDDLTEHEKIPAREVILRLMLSHDSMREQRRALMESIRQKVA